MTSELRPVDSLLTPLVYDEGRVMVFHHPYLMTTSQKGRPTHYVRCERLENAVLSFLEDSDWETVASSTGKPDYSPKELLAAIRFGNLNLHLALKSHVAKRVRRIDIQFDDETPEKAVITLANGFRDFILFSSRKRSQF
jgi:hypothetical protein